MQLLVTHSGDLSIQGLRCLQVPLSPRQIWPRVEFAALHDLGERSAPSGYYY